MRPFNLTFGASLPIFSLVSGLVTMEDCYGSKCHAIAEYCDQFAQSCISCTTICDQSTHNFNAKDCTNHCAEYNKYDILKAEIGTIRRQYTVILILLIALLILIGIRYSYMCIRWLRNKRCLSSLLKGLHPDKYANQNGKELNATTIQNVMTIGDIERAPSQVNSVIGAEGSVITTPISSRYPAENSTTPTTEYSYVNQGMVVTPVAEKTPAF